MADFGKMAADILNEPFEQRPGCACGASEGEHHKADCERVAEIRTQYDDWYFDEKTQMAKSRTYKEMREQEWGSNIPYTGGAA